MRTELPPDADDRPDASDLPHASDRLDAHERPDVEVRRSRRRTRTVSAFREGGRIIVAIPARMSRSEEREWVARMVAQLERKEAGRKPTDAQLVSRARKLSAQYLEGKAVPASVQWSARQNRRWGSCTPSDRSIRISSRLQGMPAWVVDYVLLHELVHLLHWNHDAEFWAKVGRYPDHERAKAFLEGVSWADRHDHPGAPRDEGGPGAYDGGTLDDGGPGDEVHDPQGTEDSLW